MEVLMLFYGEEWVSNYYMLSTTTYYYL